MLRAFLPCMIFCFAMFIEGTSQTTNSTFAYHPASAHKQSWERLNLWLSSAYIYVTKQGQVDQDDCLLTASHSLSLSRLSMLSEGMDDSELLVHSQWIDQGDVGKGMCSLSQATGKKHLELLLLLGAYYAFQPQNYLDYRDSVEYFLSKAVNEGNALEMDVSQAVPLGLILNEAITNSIKYGFPDGRSGVISILLGMSTPDHYSLIISDNGIGMPPQFDSKKSDSLGMSLMDGLSEDLNGNFYIETNNGTTEEYLLFTTTLPADLAERM
jgi:anti-sigma regulatory factor (Ser/Thr protein kinase)